MTRVHSAFVLACLVACAPTNEVAGEGQANRGAPSLVGQGPPPPRVPKEPAFVGEDGVDPWGGPLRRPDRAAILELLRARAFAELDRWLLHYQSEFEADARKESWAIEAFDAFEVADPQLGALLDQWVAAAPESFAAYAARGSWAVGMGFHARGTKTVDETSEAQLQAMQEHHARAVVDLERAIALRPRALAPYVDSIAVSMARDGATARAHFDAAVALCPDCYRPHVAYLATLLPRWGGSYEDVDAFVASIAPKIAAHPKLARLRGYAAWDRCRVASKEPARALPLCDEALRHGDSPMFLETRARIAHAHERSDDARKDLDRVLELAPQEVGALVLRYYVRREGGDLLGGAEDLVRAHRIDAFDSDVVKARPWLVDKLRFEGAERSKAGEHDEAADWLDLAVALAPDDKDLRTRQMWNAGKIGPEALAVRVAAAPDDYELRVLLDHALAKSQRFPEIVASWDEYLRRNPDDANAHRERGGAKWHAGKRQEAIDDTQRACDLGDARACADVQKMRARVSR